MLRPARNKRPIVWRGSSLEDLRDFPPAARREVGRQLNGEYRILVVATLGPAVNVLHAFRKKTPKTAKRDIDLARRRFRELSSEGKSR